MLFSIFSERVQKSRTDGKAYAEDLPAKKNTSSEQLGGYLPELARQGTTLRILSDRQSLGTPLATCKHLLKLNAISKTNLRWENVSTCLISRQIWPRLDHKRSAELVKLKRSQISCVVGVLTGHCLIGQHAKRLGLFSNDFCRSCRDEKEEESIPHLLCNCPALSH